MNEQDKNATDVRSPIEDFELEIKRIASEPSQSSVWTQTSQPKKINESVRRKKLENNALEQDIKLRKVVLWVLFGLLILETIAVFLFTYWQAIHWRDRFKLEDWSFRLLISASIAQISYMLQIAIRYLFPENNKPR